MFEIADEPTWRNKIAHLCSLIKVLHNICADKNGSYLSEITNIPEYHKKLVRMLSLNDNALQEHFKLFIMIYLSYNNKFCILDEPEIALGLIEAGSHRTDNAMIGYLWLICQIRVDAGGILKLLKIGRQLLWKMN